VEPVLSGPALPRAQPAIAFAWAGLARHSAMVAPFDAMLPWLAGDAGPWRWRPASPPACSPDQQPNGGAAWPHRLNHNLGTSPSFYGGLIPPPRHLIRSAFETLARGAPGGLNRRLLRRHHSAWASSDTDRARALQVLANLDPHPESVPINCPWWRLEGPPRRNRNPLRSAGGWCGWWPPLGMLCPSAGVRLSAARRNKLSREAQILCLEAGGRRFDLYGDTLLTNGQPPMCG